jgi:hypothetical protein
MSGVARHTADRADFSPTADQADAVDRVVGFIDRYGMHTPAILALEMSKPINRVASTLLLLGAPTARLLFDTDALQQLGLLLDDRRAVEYVLRRVEERA